MKKDFKIEFLDHVAIRVKDMEISISWYEKVLGLKKYKLAKWGDFPIFMLSNKCGVALFPAKQEDAYSYPTSKNVKIDHFAFRVSRENFERAKRKFAEMQLIFEIQDHYYFHSIYTKDPDGHIVELTTLVVEEKDFYKID